MRHLFLICIVLFTLSSCFKGVEVDLIIHNAKIHSMDEEDHIYESIAIQDGKIVELGPERQILNKYRAKEYVDAQGKEVYPGFTDAHGHLFSLVEQKLTADLTGSKSMQEVLVRLEKHKSRTGKSFIVGRGWDQSLWENSELPSNELLNQTFPTTPVAIFRVDGHAVLVNDFLLQQLKITPQSRIDGGIIHVKDEKCTGLLVDNAMNPIFEVIPAFSDKEISAMLLEIQEELFQYGITGVHEAGIQHKQIDILKNLVSKGDLKLDIYAMLYPEEENIAFAKKNGIFIYKNLTIRSFKVVGDGALGSRGACLKNPYHDHEHHHGVLTTSKERLAEIAEIARAVNYQMNTHAIGDSTNKLVLQELAKTFEIHKDHRWRIEHVQVLDLDDFKLLGDVGAFPSIQPVHAVSDQRWALQRLGEKRIKGAYAYQQILNQTGMCAIGTDFPVESFNPFATLFAAVKRKDTQNIPNNGFLNEGAMSLTDCLRGMTIWAAYAAFQEQTLGSLEKGKDATLFIANEKIVIHDSYKPNFAFQTYIKGKRVYSIE
jgi:predicted amidohydrolase YtcJ